jgi:CheY-like chemotaxis protein
MRKILVIDDEAPIARLITTVLKSTGIEHTMDYCSDGAQGKIKAAQGEYDLISLDINMPLMDGVEALEEMKGNPKSAGIPVVVITADEDPDLHARLLSAGAAAVVTKPAPAEDLGKLLEQVLAGGDVRPLSAPGGDSDLAPLDS